MGADSDSFVQTITPTLTRAVAPICAAVWTNVCLPRSDQSSLNIDLPDSLLNYTPPNLAHALGQMRRGKFWSWRSGAVSALSVCLGGTITDNLDD